MRKTYSDTAIIDSKLALIFAYEKPKYWILMTEYLDADNYLSSSEPVEKVEKAVAESIIFARTGVLTSL